LNKVFYTVVVSIQRLDCAGARNKLAPPCSTLKSFGSKCAVQQSTCDIAGTFRRPGNDSVPGELRPLSPLDSARGITPPCPSSLRLCLGNYAPLSPSLRICRDLIPSRPRLAKMGLRNQISRLHHWCNTLNNFASSFVCKFLYRTRKLKCAQHFPLRWLCK